MSPNNEAPRSPNNKTLSQKLNRAYYKLKITFRDHQVGKQHEPGGDLPVLRPAPGGHQRLLLPSLPAIFVINCLATKSCKL